MLPFRLLAPFLSFDGTLARDSNRTIYHLILPPTERSEIKELVRIVKQPQIDWVIQVRGLPS